MEICTSHYNENLKWLEDSPWPVTVVHKEGGEPFSEQFIQFTIPNTGFEVSSYVSYIINRYDTLPYHVAFIHGHETAQHQLGDRCLLDMIKTANIDKYEYIPLDNSWNCVNMKFMHRYLKKILPNHPDMFICCAGGQFIVSKKAIQSIPLERYQMLLDSIKSKNDAVAAELSWHIWFTGKTSCVPLDNFFNPSVKVRYSTASNIPMKISELRFVYAGALPCEEFSTRLNDTTQFINTGCTYFCENDDEPIGVMSEEVITYYSAEFEKYVTSVISMCQRFEKIYNDICSITFLP
jgi:hypothetical protein